MRVAADFRYQALDALRGKWKKAVLVGLVATLLGVAGGSGPELNVNINEGDMSASFELAGQTIFSTGQGSGAGINAALVGGFTYIMIAALIFGVLYFILSSIICVGYAKFNLMLIDGLDGSFDHLFAYFSYWKTAAATQFLTMIYTILWSLLFIIPGIMASYSYAMTSYILAENPGLSASEAIEMSKEMMAGNRWRLFCLHFSFIGWDLLATLTLGIGNLWLNPYRQAAGAAFYREVSGTEYRAHDNEWNSNIV